ncbi:MAG: hypothetical protein SGJ07_11080 [Rhodospirillaceae bacterium]|nr:hypothetical protein [Rhodospirillaceae bacterium]
MIAQIRFALLTGATIVAGAGTAGAAPQVLGLVAMNEPLVMQCDETGCKAEISSFCLQQPRDNPAHGAGYTPVDGADIALIGTTADGSQIELPAADYLAYESSRGFTSVRATLAPAAIAALGLTSVAVMVGSDVSMLPDASADDPNPQSADEIALATGAYRTQATEFFDTSGEQADAIRVTNVMINALPVSRTSTDSDGHLLVEAFDNGIAEAIDPAAIERATALHETCRQKVDVTHHIGTMRACLIGTHDRMVINSNIQFWESLGGS